MNKISNELFLLIGQDRGLIWHSRAIRAKSADQAEKWWREQLGVEPRPPIPWPDLKLAWRAIEGSLGKNLDLWMCLLLTERVRLIAVPALGAREAIMAASLIAQASDNYKNIHIAALGSVRLLRPIIHTFEQAESGDINVIHVDLVRAGSGLGGRSVNTQKMDNDFIEEMLKFI
jgi:hypothetical protein